MNFSTGILSGMSTNLKSKVQFRVVVTFLQEWNELTETSIPVSTVDGYDAGLSKGGPLAS